MFNWIRNDLKKNNEDFFIHPVVFATEPTIQAAESCAHIRNYFIRGRLNVTEQVTDLSLQFNYFHKSAVDTISSS